jgi:DNA topoisomerase VI subunit A
MYLLLAMTLKLLSIIHDLIEEGKTVTKRDIFYMDTQLFKSQFNVNRLIEHLSCKFEVSPVYLGIVISFYKSCISFFSYLIPYIRFFYLD